MIDFEFLDRFRTLAMTNIFRPVLAWRCSHQYPLSNTMSVKQHLCEITFFDRVIMNHWLPGSPAWGAIKEIKFIHVRWNVDYTGSVQKKIYRISDHSEQCANCAFKCKIAL